MSLESSAALGDVLLEDVKGGGHEVPPEGVNRLVNGMPVHIPHGSESATNSPREALATFCTAFARAKLPHYQWDIFCRTRLTPLAKKLSRVRPIAVGETLRRSAAKFLAGETQPVLWRAGSWSAWSNKVYYLQGERGEAL